MRGSETLTTEETTRMEMVRYSDGKYRESFSGLVKNGLGGETRSCG